MRTPPLLAAIASALLAACGSPAHQPPAGDPPMRTVSSETPAPSPLAPPPTLQDEAALPATKASRPARGPQSGLTTEDEKMRASLPFTPAIAMDPVDGSKISIRAATPTFEYKSKIYYFSNETNRQTFAANPEQYLKGGMMRL